MLIGIPRADAVLSLPALTIPRMERRVLGSIYGSSKPERDFPHTLALYRSGRLPLDRLVSAPASARPGGARVRADAIRRGAPRGARACDVRPSWTGGSARAGAARAERLARQRRPRAAGQPDRGGRDLDARPPRSRPHTRARLRRADAGRVRARLAADADDEQGDRARRRPPDDDLGRRAARDRPGRARRRRGRARSRRPATSSCSSPSGSIRRANDETAVREANRAAVRKAIGVCVEGRDPARRGRARRAPRLAAQPLLLRRVDAHRGDRDAALPLPARPAVPARRGIPFREPHQDATIVVVRSDDGVEGYASGDDVPDRELLERLLVGLDRLRDGARARNPSRRSTSTAGATGSSRSLSGICSDARRGEPLWRLLGGTTERILAYASSGELVDADERVRRCRALRDAGVRAVKLRLHSSDWRVDLPVDRGRSRARRRELEVMVDANQGWRMPGDLTRALGSRDRAQAFAASSSGSASTGSRSRSARTTSTATRRWPARRPAHRRRRDGALGARGARRSSPAAASTSSSPTSSSPAGSPVPPRSRRSPTEHGRTWSPHTWSNGYGLLANLHAALAFSTCPYIEVPFDPPAWSARAARLAPPRHARDRAGRDDRAAGRPRSRRRPRLRRPRAVPGRLTRLRAAVLHKPRTVLIVDESLARY